MSSTTGRKTTSAAGVTRTVAAGAPDRLTRTTAQAPSATSSPKVFAGRADSLCRSINRSVAVAAVLRLDGRINQATAQRDARAAMSAELALRQLVAPGQLQSSWERLLADRKLLTGKLIGSASPQGSTDLSAVRSRVRAEASQLAAPHCGQVG